MGQNCESGHFVAHRLPPSDVIACALAGLEQQVGALSTTHCQNSVNEDANSAYVRTDLVEDMREASKRPGTRHNAFHSWDPLNQQSKPDSLGCDFTIDACLTEAGRRAISPSCPDIIVPMVCTTNDNSMIQVCRSFFYRGLRRMLKLGVLFADSPTNH